MIEKKNYFFSKESTKDEDEKRQMHQSLHRLADDKTIKEHIEKSRNLNT